MMGILVVVLGPVFVSISYRTTPTLLTMNAYANHFVWVKYFIQVATCVGIWVYWEKILLRAGFKNASDDSSKEYTMYQSARKAIVACMAAFIIYDVLIRLL